MRRTESSISDRRLDVGAAGRRPDQTTEDACDRVDDHRLLDVGEVAVAVEHAAGRADADQRAEGVEKAHENEREQDREERQFEHARDVEMQRDRRERIVAAERHRDQAARRFREAEEHAGSSGGDDADEDRAAHSPLEQRHDHDESRDRQQHLGAPQVADLHRYAGAGGHDPGLGEADEREKESDARGEAVLEARGD
jgi:hypothetical protein